LCVLPLPLPDSPAHGANVVINGFGGPPLVSEIKKALEARGAGKVLYHAADLSDVSQIRDLLDVCNKELGGVDILINNAGIQHISTIEEFPIEKFDFILALMLAAPFHLIQGTVPHMKKNGWGRIINIGSVHSLVASVNKSAYVAAKHGLHGLTKAVALETAPCGITVNTICPGFVYTTLIQEQITLKAKLHGISEEEGQRVLLGEKQPSLQFVKPEDLAALVLFLCSPAAAQITGTSIPVDGGWTAQ